MAQHTAQTPNTPTKKRLIISLGIVGALFIGSLGVGAALHFTSTSAPQSAPETAVVQDKAEDPKPQKKLPPIDWSALKQANPDTVGWISAPETPINYPIMRPPLDKGSFYLDHNPKRESDINGSIYLMPGDRFSDAAPLLLGHNMNDGSMFARFSSYINPDVDPSHQKILIETPSAERVLYPVAVFVVDSKNESCLNRPDDMKDLKPWAEKFFAQEHRSFAQPDYQKQLWLFCTCKNDTANKRIILVAQEHDE